MEDFEIYDERPTIITIGGNASDFASAVGDNDEYSNLKGKFMQKRAANVAKRQDAKQQIVQAKAATKAVKQEARAEKKVGRQEVRGAKQVAKQVRKTDKIQARDVKKQARVGMRNTAKAGRLQGRQDKRTLRTENRMARREMRNPVSIPTEPQYEEELPVDNGGGYAEDAYAPEEQGGYETNGEVEDTEEGGSYDSQESSEDDGYYEEGDANPMYSEGGYDSYLPDYMSEEGGYADEIDEAFAGANGHSSVAVRPRRMRERVQTRVSPSARFSQNRIVVPSEKKSNFDSNDSTKGLIALDDDKDYDAPEETVIDLGGAKSAFDGSAMSKTTMAILGIGALLTIGYLVSRKK